MRYDNDPFNRWDATQSFAVGAVLARAKGTGTDRDVERLGDALGAALGAPDLDPAFKALILTLPSEREIAQSMDLIDVEAIFLARKEMIQSLAHRLHAPLMATYTACALNEPYVPTSEQMAVRALRGAALRLLGKLETAEAIALAERHFGDADNMTDTMAALTVLSEIDTPARANALAAFYTRWKDTPLVVDKWLTLQAVSPLPGTVERIRALMTHEAFALTNPNKVRALIGAFAHNNPRHFHSADGAGYRLVAETIAALDDINPQIAARLATAFDSWRRLDLPRQTLAREALQTLAARPGASGNLQEMTTRLLA